MFDPLFFRVANTYRKKTTIKAVRWSGLISFDGIIAFIGETNVAPDNIFEVTGKGGDGGWRARVYDDLHNSWICLEVGDWIARGPKDEYYPIKADVFAETYELVD